MSFVRRRILTFVLTVIRHPRATLLIALLAVGGCATFAKLRLNISTDQNKLFSADVPFFRDYLSYIDKFPENEAIYIVVQSRDPKTSPPVDRWTSVADAITDRLRAMHENVTAVDDRVPIDKLGTQGLLFDDRSRVAQTVVDARRFIPLARLWGEKPGIAQRVLGATPMAQFLSGVNLTKVDAETAGFVGLLADSWQKTLAGTGDPTLPNLAALDETDPSRLGYYYVVDEQDHSRHQLLVRVYPNAKHTSLTAISEAVEAIRAAAVDAAKPFPEFVIGTTGRPALEADEMRTTDTDSHRAEVVALIVVFIGMSLMLRSIWLALAAEISLACGIAWTFGWATISIGELNLLSIVFLIALIGIGMDYLVQILVRYRRESARYERSEAIWVRVFAGVSAPINTACFGAAGAFLVSVFTHFPGTAQLGVIAGGGLLLCLLSGYTVLPALLTVFPVKARKVVSGERFGIAKAQAAGWRFVWPAIWVAAVVAGIPFARRVDFNPGLLELQAQNLESVKLVNTLQTWYAVVLSNDLNVLRRVRAIVADDPDVASTDSILQAIDNQAFLDQPQNALPMVNWSAPPPIPAGELKSLAGRCRDLATKFATVKDTRHAVDSLRAFAAILAAANADGPAMAERLTRWQAGFVDELRITLDRLHPQPLDVGKLPTELRGHYVSDDGVYALYVYPSKDLWNRGNLQEFVRAVESLTATVPGAPAPTGIAINVLYSTSGIKGSFINATLYALILIVLLVYLDLRRVDETLMAISVLALGLPMLIAIMGILGVQWNFANFFGLPILIGAGHEYGVFLVHRYRESLAHPRRVWQGWDVSDRALLLCAFVTSSSFGFFWLLGHHLGLRSLGLVMAIGTACIYGAAICVLEPLLKWRLSRK